MSQDKRLQVLHLEDEPDDTELVRNLLEAEKISAEINRVQTRRDFEEALKRGNWDLIISDFKLPSFDGMKALAMARQVCPDIPFVLFSGTIGEEVAVESIKNGAADYVIKYRPDRLAVSVRKALQLAAECERVRRIEEELKKGAERERQMETRFLRMQRMESIGALVSGIAHDLNNALVPVLMGCSFLRCNPPKQDVAKILEAMETNARHGADMLKQVLAFARGIETGKSAVEIKLIFREMEMIVRETFPRTIRLRVDCAKDLWCVSAHATQLHQVLMNLCINARDAMPTGGELKLAARNAVMGKDNGKPGCSSGPYVVLSVSDTGTGMSAEVIEKLFQPFFTTKDGKGTGLGLSTSLNIVKNHGGIITIESRVGQGSRFDVYLPALNTSTTPEAEPKLARLPTGNGERILLVDDEIAVCEVSKAALENYGYQVLIANSGPEAVVLYCQRQEEISLAVTDSDMPLMTGPATCLALRKLNERLPIIMASGTTPLKGEEDTELQINAFVPKPYTLEKLLETVHWVLEARGKSPQER